MARATEGGLDGLVYITQQWLSFQPFSAKYTTKIVVPYKRSVAMTVFVIIIIIRMDLFWSDFRAVTIGTPSVNCATR